MKYTFLSRFFRANLDLISAWIANQAYLEVENIFSVAILLPKYAEQQQIVHYIETETTRIDTEIQSTQKEIDLLREYRQALIAEAVTGKIDVRDYPLT